MLCWVYVMFMLMSCSWDMSFFQKSGPTPSLLFHDLFLSLIWAQKVASTIFWRDNQKLALPWEGNTVQCIIPPDIPAFIFHVSYNMYNNSICQWTHQCGWQAHNAWEKSICWWHPFKGNWASRDNVCHFGSYPCGLFGPKPLPLFF